MQFELKYNPQAKDIDTIYAGLDTFNEPQFADAEEHTLACLVRDDAQQLLGGLYGRRMYEALQVKYLWVSRSIRDQGIGSRLIEMVEQEARLHHVSSIFLDTYSFQAPEFYHKLGFVEVGRYQDFPKPGVDKIFFQKRLSPDA